MTSKKPLIIGGVAAFVLVAGWAGASWQVQRAVDARIRDGMGLQDPKVPVRFARLQQRAGFRQSSGEADVLMHVQCGAANGPDTPIGHLRYDTRQGLNPFGPQQVHWQFDVAPQPAGAPAASASDVMLTLVGDGSVDRWGNSDQKIAFTPGGKLGAKDGLRIEPLDVSLRVDGAIYRGDLRLPAFHVSDPKGAVDVKTVTGHFEVPTGRRYDASYVLGVEDISGPELALHGVRVEARSKAEGDALAIHGAYRVAGGHVAGKDLKDLVLELSMDGLPVADLERLQAATDARCRAGHTDGAIDAPAAREAAAHLLRHGFHVAIERLSGTVGDGAVDGALKVEMRGTPEGQPISSTTALKASGHLRVAGRDLMPASIDQLVQQHLVVADGEGMKTSFDFSDGRLTLNGSPMDLPFVQLMQARLDAELAGLPAGGNGGAPQGAEAAPAQ